MLKGDGTAMTTSHYIFKGSPKQQYSSVADDLKLRASRYGQMTALKMLFLCGGEQSPRACYMAARLGGAGCGAITQDARRHGAVIGVQRGATPRDWLRISAP